MRRMIACEAMIGMETYPSTSFLQARSVKTVKIPGGVAKLHWDKTFGITIG